MKIIVTSFYLPPTDRIGAGVQLHMLANAYVRLGHEVTVVSPSCVRDTDALYELETINIGGSNRILKWAVALAQYNFEADIVHFGGDDFLVPSSGKFRHIRTFMGSCLAEAKVATTLRDQVRMTLLGMTEFISSVRFPRSTVISQDTNRYLGRRCDVIPCGIDLQQFTPSSNKCDNPAILFVGMLDSRKRGRALLTQFHHVVRRELPTAELWIVRDTEQVSMPGVTVYGSVSQDQLIDLYQRSWVFCLPSAYEGFGVPYIEAMACGTPVVATQNPGAVEVLGNGTFGIITELNLLGQTLLSVLSDEQLREKMTNNGLQRTNMYDINRIAEQYIDIARVGRN